MFRFSRFFAAAFSLCVLSATTGSVVLGQQGILSTVAGRGPINPREDCDYPATTAMELGLHQASNLELLPDGSYLIMNSFCNAIFRVASDGSIVIAAGIPGVRRAQNAPLLEGVLATSGPLDLQATMAVDAAGNTYFTEPGYDESGAFCTPVIRRLDPDGIVTSVAGTGARYVAVTSVDEIFNSFTAYSGPAGEITLDPTTLSMTEDASGNIYFTQFHFGLIQRLTPDGQIQHVAGRLQSDATFPDSTGDGGSALDAMIAFPNSLAIGPDGAIYVAEIFFPVKDGDHPQSYRIRKISPNGIISHYAGTGDPGDSGDGGLATQCQFYWTETYNHMAVSPVGDLIVADSFNNRWRRIDRYGYIHPFVGSGLPGSSGDGELGLDGSFLEAADIQFLPNGDFLLADTGNGLVRKVSGGFAVPSGTAVVVNTLPQMGINISAHFTEVAEPGSLFVDISSAPPAGLPFGVSPVGPHPFYEVRTTARFSGPVLVTLSYGDITPDNDSDDLSFMAFHFEGVYWENATVAIRPELNEIDAQVSHLSPFSVVVAEAGANLTRFRRADSNDSDEVDLSDAITVLSFLFLGGVTLSCMDAADANDSGEVDLSDAITILSFLFLGGTQIPYPGTARAGFDPTDDLLSCAAYSL